jgi:hypothetical protein
LRPISEYCWVLFVLFGFLGNLVASLGNVLAGAFNRVACREDGGCAAEDNEHDECHSQFASHK